MYIPTVTYRIQFNKKFTFRQLGGIIPYLSDLGVSAIYASPVFKAVPGSTHGYDGLNPNMINPEIGTLKELEAISNRLKELGISWLQDIVPNHMAFHPANTWLMDVLEKGETSEYSGFFDISTNGEKIMVPFLSASLEQVIKKGEIQVGRVDGKSVVTYFESNFPLNVSLSPDEIEEVNGDQAVLKRLLDNQYYRLCHWQETDKHINYRRFFTINGLICINIQNREVFDAYHRLIRDCINKGIFQGLRVDHVDGLYDPSGYLERLRKIAGDDTNIVVEKILEQNERFPNAWPVQGNTGYDFLGMVNNLFTLKTSEKAFTTFYEEFTEQRNTLSSELRDKKANILYKHMGGELDNLYQLFISSGFVSEKEISQAGEDNMRQTIAEFLILCPVYRYYTSQMPLAATEKENIEKIVSGIEKQTPPLSAGVALLKDAIIVRPGKGDTEYDEKALHFFRRLMQFSGPLMAKGVEDTLMYTYNRYIVHNEVGDSPRAFGSSIEEFHELMKDRLERLPFSMNATATHDTKRGEDSRARLNVLADMPSDWFRAVKEWQRLNKKFKTNNAPDNNDEYFIYQSLLGAFPMSGKLGDDILPRLKAYFQKAMREAKRHSKWTLPNEMYETAVLNFVDNILNENSPFLESFTAFHRTVVDHGVINSLSQLALKFTCPGTPDIYQGTELWNLSFVDPDNRRPVDFGKRGSILKGLPEATFAELWSNRHSGQIKLWLTNFLAMERKVHPHLFSHGRYLPLGVKGKYKENVLAFARLYDGQWLIVAIPLHTAALCKNQACAFFDVNWKNTRLILPDHAPSQWQHPFASEPDQYEKEIVVSELFKNSTIILLKSANKNAERNAGILLPISSLPSPFGVGDIGPEAYSFADFLHKSCQRYWQILPINPTNASHGHSPYSSISTMAGNTLLLSPDLLVEAGLLTDAEVDDVRLPDDDKADYGKAESNKSLLFDIAFRRYKNERFPALEREFAAFCKAEDYWLDDYALFVVLKKFHGNKPWHEWPDDYKNREEKALDDFATDQQDEIEKAKLLQLLFSLQWSELKLYCNILGIKLFGDIPFYVSYDSADVWATHEIFCLDEDGHMTGIAGVPPDYFSEDGQLWGMPTYNWQKLEETSYDWWMKRLKKNLQLFDLLRLDHFRAFAEYWQVTAGEETAKNGQWLPGPGAHFFDVVKREIGDLPFVSEDLGDNMEKVYALRDKIGLPGMKVLQFAFGEHMPMSVDIPHNYTVNCIAYTGTHDNNTTVGWYDQETSKADHKRMEQYLGSGVRIRNIHNVLARMAYSSVAKTAILPMQDLLGLGKNHRTNTPGSDKGNWLWRVLPGQLNEEVEQQLRKWTKLYGRAW